MIIEFLGRPGSGKSTIATELAREPHVELGVAYPWMGSKSSLLRRAMRKSRVDYILYRTLLRARFATHPYLTTGTLSRYLSELAFDELGQREIQRRKRLLIRDLLTHLAIRQMKSQEAYVLEEGLVQRGVSGSLSGVSDAVLRRHYQLIPMADLYVHVDAPDPVLTRRLVTRDGGAHKLISKNAFDLARLELESRGALVVDVDGEASLGEAVDSIRPYLHLT